MLSSVVLCEAPFIYERLCGILEALRIDCEVPRRAPCIGHDASDIYTHIQVLPGHFLTWKIPIMNNALLHLLDNYIRKIMSGLISLDEIFIHNRFSNLRARWYLLHLTKRYYSSMCVPGLGFFFIFQVLGFPFQTSVRYIKKFRVLDMMLSWPGIKFWNN